MFAKDVLRIVSGALQDLDPGVESRWRWDGGDDGMVGLLDFLNLAVSEVVMQRPDATATSGNLRLDPGVWQRVPTAAVTFIGCNFNVGEDGRAQGQPITTATPDTVMAWAGTCAALPWGCGTGFTVECFAYDRMTDPRRFLVYPAVPEVCDAVVNASWSVKPAIIESPEQDMALAGLYLSALVHHVLYSVLSGDNEASNAARAQHHLSAFYQSLGTKMNTDSLWPKARNTGGGQ